MFYSFKCKPKWLIADNAIIGASVSWILVNTICHALFTIVKENEIVMEIFLPNEDQFSQKVAVYYLPSSLVGLFYVPHIFMAVTLCSLAFLIRRVYRRHSNDAKNFASSFMSLYPLLLSA